MLLAAGWEDFLMWISYIVLLKLPCAFDNLATNPVRSCTAPTYKPNSESKLYHITINQEQIITIFKKKLPTNL